MTRFVPARFALYEFDDRDQQAGPVRRWLNHWDGAVGQPAEEVALAWSVDDAVVLVCTSGRDYDDAEARSRAAHLALGGNTLPVANQSVDVADTVREMECLSSTHQAWSQPKAALDLRFTTTATPEFLTGYLLLDYGAVFFAAAPARQPRIRPVDNWTRYDVDATVEFPLSALHRD